MTIKEECPDDNQHPDDKNKTGWEIGHKVEMTFNLDKEKIEQIHRCLKNGKLTLTINKANLLESGRFQNGYLYD